MEWGRGKGNWGKGIEGEKNEVMGEVDGLKGGNLNRVVFERGVGGEVM